MRGHAGRANRRPATEARAAEWDESEEQLRKTPKSVRKLAKSEPAGLQEPAPQDLQWPKWPEWLIEQTVRNTRDGAAHAKEQVGPLEECWQNLLRGHGYRRDAALGLEGQERWRKHLESRGYRCK